MTDLVSNRKAFHDYEILETLESGIALVGTEVKSLREHHGSLSDAFVIFEEGEAILISSAITPYRFGNVHNHEERRKRKLLLHKKEIFDLKRKREEKGLTIIPLLPEKGESQSAPCCCKREKATRQTGCYERSRG